jgi:hypothetical protein
VAICGAATAAPPQSAPTPSGSNFAIADFDGDRIPDLARVEFVQLDSLRARYSIRFQLSAGPEQFFGLTAPLGGLQLVSRDVNGDNAPDLIVSTAWQHEPVAILLNDGRGNFTLVDPAQFSAALSEPPLGWTVSSVQVFRTPFLIRTESSFPGECEQANGPPLPQQLPGFLFWCCSGVQLFPQRFSFSSRAPPRFSPLA